MRGYERGLSLLSFISLPRLPVNFILSGSSISNKPSDDNECIEVREESLYVCACIVFNNMQHNTKHTSDCKHVFINKLHDKIMADLLLVCDPFLIHHKLKIKYSPNGISKYGHGNAIHEYIVRKMQQSKFSAHYAALPVNIFDHSSI